MSFLLASVLWIGAQQTIAIDQLGTRNSFCGYRMETVRDLQNFLDEYRSDILSVLRSARVSSDPESLFSAVAQGRVREIRVQPGETLAWMAVRKNRRPTILERVRWTGREAFDAFEVRLQSGCVEERLVIPKTCGNISLLSTSTTAAPESPSLGVRQASRCAGERVTAEVTSTGNEVELRLQRPGGGSELLNLTPGPSGLQWSAVLNEPGGYRLTATAVNACGASAPVSQEFTLEPCVPICRIRLFPPVNGRTAPGKSAVRVDLSESRAEIGTIAAASVAVYREGSLVENLRLDPAPFETEWVLPEYGTYQFVGQVRDQRGVVSQNGCTGAFAFQEPPRRGPSPFGTAFVGLERRWRAVEPIEGIPIEALEDESAPLVGGTGGVLLPLSRSFAFFGQFGAAVNLETREHSSLFADFGGDVFFESGFLGGGIGIWDINNEETRDSTILVHGGIDTPWKIGGATVQWFVEGRLFLDMLDMIENNYFGATGLRIVVKP